MLMLLNGIKTLIPNGLSTFLIKDNPVFSNGPKSLNKILLIDLFYVTELLKILYHKLIAETKIFRLSVSLICLLYVKEGWIGKKVYYRKI